MAQGVPRPEGLPSGPVRTLVYALHDLYEDAGMPSMRAISTAIRKREELPDTVSHETVGQLLRGESVPGWSKLESVVRHLAGVAVQKPDIQTEVERFHHLWLAVAANRSSSPSASTVEVVRPPAVVTEDAAPRTPSLIGEIPPRNVQFVGRAHTLRAIHEILRTAAPVVALTGIGGVGKSQLAIQYAHLYREAYDLVWWAPAEDPSQLRASLARLGARMNLPSSAVMQHPPAQVLDALRGSDLRWLLVFDNAGAPASLPDLRSLGKGRVLLTSRSPDWASYGTQIQIDVFERSESVDLLRNRASDISVAEADRLAARLGDLPLALEQVAIWHRTTGVPVSSYLDDLDQQMQNILSDSRTKAANYPATVSGFLRVAFTQLAETAPEAAQLLELFAWLGADPVSLGLLRRGRRGAVTSPLRETLQEPSRLSKAVHDLRRYGLAIVINDDPLRVQVHRVFQRVLRDWLADKRLARGRANVQAILAAANPGEPDDARSWGHYAEVGPHIQVAGLTTAVDFEIRLAALDQMRYLFRIGHYLESIELGQSLIASTELVEQNELSDARHHFYVSARHRLANAMRMVGRYSEAKELTLEALDYLERHPDFGSQDEYLAGLDMNRAADLRIAGNYANALTVDEVALDGQLRRDLDDQDKIRTIRNNIAVNLRLLGRFSEAHEIDREIVAQWTNARGAYDPRTLFARCNLARDLYGLGRYAEALNEVRACLPVYRDVVGANHHGVLLAVRTEVMALRKLGELASAFRLAEQNHRDLTTWFDPKHEYTLAAGISLLNVRLAMDDLGIAATQGTLLLGECADLFGPEHPMTLAVMVNAASASRALDDVHSALASDRRAVESLGRVLGAGHPYTLCAHHNMSVDLALLGRHDEALAAATTVLTRSAATRGDSHPDTLACAVNVGQAGGAPSDQTLRAFEDALGRSHPLVVAARDGTWIACDIEPPPA